MSSEKLRQKSYRGTITACFLGYVVQSVVNTFVPLLFLTFQSEYGIPLAKITMLVTINFFLQLCIDLASAFFVEKIGYRACAVLANSFAAAGLILLTILPKALPDPFVGLLLSVFVYAIGGGLLEVVISPIVEASPSEHKAKTMSLLHSFYCWGSVAVVCISTLFFSLAGTEKWKILSLCWAILPIANAILFLFVPIVSLTKEGETALKVPQLLKKKSFWLFFLLILCAGAAEAAIVQWSSAFAEKGLGVSKTTGDLAGPALFSVTMGLSRLLYGKFGDKTDLKKIMTISGVLCVISYLIMAFSSSAAFALFGMALCGFSVGIMWPGTYSMAAENIRGGGGAMFALLALGGDIGCTSGPSVVGFVSDLFGENFKIGILFASFFPVLLTVLLLGVRKRNRGALSENAEPESDETKTNGTDAVFAETETNALAQTPSQDKKDRD